MVHGTGCRICGSSDLISVINLGNQVLTSRFPPKGDHSTPSAPMILMKCNYCHLVQLKDAVSSSELYEHTYGYRSGISNTMREHLKQLNEEIQTFLSQLVIDPHGASNSFPLTSGDAVLDIGSNDATFLKYYPSELKRVGVDPTGKQFKEYYDSNIELIPYYFSAKLLGERKFKVVTSFSMFYDLPDPVGFARDVYKVLTDDGIWVMEQSYLPTMLERNSFDTICHEHIEYYTLTNIYSIAQRSGLQILKVSFNDCNGGSFRVYLAKNGSNYPIEGATIRKIMKKEIHTTSINTYFQFNTRCLEEMAKLKLFLRTAKSCGKRSYIYGASTKGNTLLQFAELNNDLLQYAVERNPLKVGLMTPGTEIEIISEETMRADPPDYLLVLPWHFKEEIIQREAAYLEAGGQLIFPLPEFTLVSKRQKVLITGIDGQIGSYLKESYSDSIVYGVSRKRNNPGFTFEADLSQEGKITMLMKLIKPDLIIHLAAISNAHECETDALLCDKVNRRVCVEILGQLDDKTRFFHASSSEIYKGWNKKEIREDDQNYLPTNNYSKAKLTAHIEVIRARNEAKWAANGVIFTTESKRRKEGFLLKKLIHGAKTQHPITLGDIRGARCYTHASDVARAIKLIMEHSVAQDYLIANPTFYDLEEVIMKVYTSFGVSLINQDHHFRDKHNHDYLIKWKEEGDKSRIKPIVEKLYTIGWKPEYNLDMIIEDMK